MRGRCRFTVVATPLMVTGTTAPHCFHLSGIPSVAVEVAVAGYVLMETRSQVVTLSRSETECVSVPPVATSAKDHCVGSEPLGELGVPTSVTVTPTEPPLLNVTLAGEMVQET